MRKIVFVGNCQGRRLQVFFAEAFAYLNGDTAEFVLGYEPVTDQVLEVLRRADIIVAQEFDWENSVNVENVETNARIIQFPKITGAALWPYSGVQHIYNKTLPYCDGGPFEFGDRWLNRKIRAGVPPADIIDEYLNLDIAKAVDLDRIYEIHIDLARKRDERTGFAIAPVIESRLTEEPLFMCPSNLELPLFMPLARGIYERLGVAWATIDRALEALWRSPFPAVDLPIHPSVARHFGLKFITPGTRYRIRTGERVTFHEWLERYVNFQWNDALLRGSFNSSRVRRFDAEAAARMNLLQSGLQASSGSDLGYASLGHLLVMKGDNDAALETYRRLEAFDPANPAAPINVAHLLAERGDLAEAEAHITSVTVKWPHHAEGWGRLALIRERRGDGPGAIEAIRRAVELGPRILHLLLHYFQLFDRFAPAENPYRALYHAITIDPYDPALFGALARLEADHGRLQDALTHIGQAIRLAPDDAEWLSRKADILARSGCLAEAEATFAEALALAPNNADVHEARAKLAIDLGQVHTAMEAASHAVRLDPEKRRLLNQFADRLARSGQLTEAAEMYRRAIERDWNNAELIRGLARVLSRQGETVDAVMLFHRAMQLAPHDPESYCQVAEQMVRHDDFLGAEAILETARREAPAHPHVLGLLALSLLRQGRFATALEAIAGALEIDPDNPHLTARHAVILSEMGDCPAAEEVLNKAIAMLPTAGGFHALLGTLLLRQGRRSDAKIAYREALRYEPHHSGYRMQLEELAEA